MIRKYLLRSTLNVATLSRLIAKGIDIFIVLVFSIFFYPLGLILSIIYMGISDSLQDGQSIGKKFMGFSVISLEDGSPCSIKQSFVRNLPLLVPLVLAIIPFWGWILSCLVGAPLIIFEVYLMYKLDSAHRVGDVMADTTVIAGDGQALSAKNKNASWFDKTNAEV